MIAQALFFYLFHSVKNRLMVRIRRMKEPRYLIGGIAGGFYMYFYFWRSLHRSMYGAANLQSAHHDLMESIFALVFFGLILSVWILPQSRAALTFTEAEVAFLFPAPVSRQNLINFKLLRSQAGILFSSLIMAFVGRFGAAHFYSGWIGWWIILAAFNLHILGSSFAVTMMMDSGISNWRRRLFFIGGLTLALIGLGFWLWKTFPPPPDVKAGAAAFSELLKYLSHALESGPLPYILYPFKLVLAPFFSRTLPEFLLALPAALGILALHYLWVIRSNVSFEEASIEKSRRVAETRASMRSGNWQTRKLKKAARAPFQLGASGFPGMALLWKNLIAAGSLVTIRFWIMLVWIIVGGGMLFQSQMNHGLGLAATSLIGMILAFSLLLGPNLLRNDLRQDLPMTDFLKSLPLRGWQVVLGEVLAPVAMLVAVQWLLLILALIFCPSEWEHHALPLWSRVGVFLGAMLLMPPINFANLLIRNIAVLLFPAWFQLGREGPRGFENTGQQMILVLGQTLALALALLPAAAIFVGVWLVVTFLLGPALAIVVASVAALVVLAAEVVLAVRLIGGVFERFDLSKESLTPG